MSDIAVGDTVRRVKPCKISACEDSWHRLGWVGVVASRSERALYFGAGAQGGSSNYERVTQPTESDDDSIPDDASRLVAKVKAARENASTQPTDPHTKPLGTSPEPVKSGLDSSHMDHGNRSKHG